MVRGATAFLLASVLAVALIAAPSAAAGEPTVKVKVAKHKDGPYRPNINTSIDPGETRSLWFRAANPGTEELDLVFGDAGTSDEDGFKTRWFKSSDNISNQVERPAGYPFHLNPGQRKLFNAKQTAPDAPGVVEGCLAGGAEVPKVTGDLATVEINDAMCAF
jgi:hypothetical protein